MTSCGLRGRGPLCPPPPPLSLPLAACVCLTAFGLQATTKEVKDSLGKQWSQLSDKKRLKWIHKALEQRKEYEVRLPLRSSPSGSSRASALRLCDLRTLREAVTPCPSIEGGAFWAPHLCPYLPRPPPLHEISG